MRLFAILELNLLLPFEVFNLTESDCLKLVFFICLFCTVINYRAYHLHLGFIRIYPRATLFPFICEVIDRVDTITLDTTVKNLTSEI